MKMKYSHIASAEKVHGIQTAFVERHRVPLGWLLYRDDTADGGFGRHVTGASQPLVPDQGDQRYLLVEEAFFRSCPPQIAASGFETGAATMLAEDPARRAALSRQGFHRTAQMRGITAQPTTVGEPPDRPITRPLATPPPPPTPASAPPR